MPEDATIAAELVALQRRLAAMIDEASAGADVRAELGRIRAALLRLASENEEVRRHLDLHDTAPID